MAVFKFVIGSKSGKTFQLEKDQKEAASIIGMKIGDKFNAGFIGLEGYELRITGGSDRDGFPMRRDIAGTQRKRIILTKGIGFRGKKKTKKGFKQIKGMRKKKMIRGNQIDKDIAQINCVVVKEGTTPLDNLVGKKEAQPDKKETGEKEAKDVKEDKKSDELQPDKKETDKKEAKDVKEDKKSGEAGPDKKETDKKEHDEKKAESEAKGDEGNRKPEQLSHPEKSQESATGK
ncbi:MAG: 30S ribosomal protein S6e [Candidatus Aenigmatarchaeota archaeon]|nr:MAG: 30S ribosomal protein S6e [Candidatus Aenigmarchaeota archaeon]